MNQGRASSLGQTPVKCASVRWVTATLRGGEAWTLGGTNTMRVREDCASVARRRGRTWGELKS